MIPTHTRPIRWVVAAILLCAVVAPARSAPRQPELATAIAERDFVGAVWSTVAADGSIAAGAAGSRNAASRAPMRATDKVQVGSIAKTVLATGILRLVREGRLRLDAPVAKLLPDVAIDNRWAADSPLRLRHLLDHSSGLDDARLWQVFSREATPDTPLGEAIPAKLRVRSRPGSRFSYSNTGYALLGMVIERTVGERYESYLDRAVLAPLGMRDSSVGFVTQASDPRLAMGHFERGAPHPAVPLYVRPASQFTTTAHDMALFARFLLGDGRIDGRPFIAPRLMRARGRPWETDAARAGLESGYALGLARQERGGAVGLCHGGDTVGYRAMLCLYPAQRRAFFRAINADVEGGDYRSIDAMLVRALDLPVRAAAVATPMPRDVAAWQGLYVPSPVRFETFAYVDQVLGFLTVSRQGDRLRLNPFQGAPRMLVPVGGRLFRADDRTVASHVLLVDRDGQRLIGSEFQTFRQVAWWQIAPLWLGLAAGLLGLGHLLVAGLVRAVRGRLAPSEPLFYPFLAVVALAIPALLFATQPFLAMGDLTAASAAAAVSTGLLAPAMVLGLVRRVQAGVGSWGRRLELVAMAAVLQWTITLMLWGLVPLRLWA